MKTKIYFILSLITIIILNNLSGFSQCTEENDPDMARYKKLTETQDAQGCSQCAMLALYFCSATYSVKIEDKRKVSALITACKKNILNMGEPHCCQDLLDKQPQWGIKAGGSDNNQHSNSGGTSTNGKGNGNNSGNQQGNGNSTAGSSITNAQNSGEVEDVLNSILKQLVTDPDNPLDIDKDFLTGFSQLLPESSLKQTLQSYGSNLGSDDGLSYRQVYWDVASGFEQNPEIAGQSQFAKTQTGLSILLDNSEMITDRFKNNVANYQPGIFMTDLDFIQGVSNITGSYESAMALSAGVDLAVGLYALDEENQKFKAEYIKLAKLSIDQVYTEKDQKLNKALIDAAVGIDQHSMITPIYRYDFDNGACLRVENGILKYINSANKINIELTKAEKRHDGNFYKRSVHGGQILQPAICISSDESLFYLFTGDNVFHSANEGHCLEEKTGYLINSINGEVLGTRSKLFAPKIAEVRNMHFNQDSIIVWHFQNSVGNFRIYQAAFFKDKQELKTNYIYRTTYLDKQKSFVFIGKPENMHLNFCDPNNKNKNNYSFDKNNFRISLLWGEDSNKSNCPDDEEKEIPGHHSSMLQITNAEKYFNTDVMVNELTGLAMSKAGDLFFIAKNGSIGKLKTTEYNLDNQDLPKMLRNSMTKKIVAPYDFNAEKKYISRHGRILFSHSSIFPSLYFTPDEKWLIYIVNDHLYIINPSDFNDVKSFSLTFEPNNCFFGKENGNITLYIQGQNDFKFPITKKYSLDKLLTAKTEDKKTIAKLPEGQNKGTKENNNGSVADEIKKLKTLLEEGAITNEEYAAAKKKLLEKN